VTDSVVVRLQESVLAAVLDGQPLPGSDSRVMLPDLAYVLRHDPVLVSEENLAGPLNAERFRRSVLVLSEAALAERAQTEGDVAYLRFQPAERRDGTVRLTLEARIAPSDAARQALGLSGIQVGFQEVDGHWKVIGEPTLFAA
jgi:hypothetical protein